MKNKKEEILILLLLSLLIIPLLLPTNNNNNNNNNNNENQCVIITPSYHIHLKDNTSILFFNITNVQDPTEYTLTHTYTPLSSIPSLSPTTYTLPNREIFDVEYIYMTPACDSLFTTTTSNAYGEFWGYYFPPASSNIFNTSVNDIVVYRDGLRNSYVFNMLQQAYSIDEVVRFDTYMHCSSPNSLYKKIQIPRGLTPTLVYSETNTTYVLRKCN